jgi:tetratricopeptide (TPR) repeat protein/tRNA A-37 threonylcarbamoyl transferase component Bud32/TolB-like protein
MPDLLERLKSALENRYAVESEIGRGGMATVYLAEDLKHSRKVAIKVLHPELAASVGHDRFLREIETVAGLTHPHVLPLHDSGDADGLLFFVMPYVKGENLRQRLEREKQLPVDEAIQIAQAVAGALDHAHREGVVHRDIKPANILLEEGHAVVADFGVARAVSAAGGESVTATGMAVGTPAYMSPEQAAGEEVDERSDLYALGCILYEMLAGEPPLVGPTPQATAAKRLANRPTPLGAIRTTIPANLASLAERALAPTAADRPATARKLADELEEVRRSPGPAARKSPAARWLTPAVGLAAIAVVAAIVWMLATNRFPTRQARLGPYSVAILPLANNTGDDSLDWYRPVLTDMLNTGLVQLEGLTVVSAQRLLDLIRQTGHEETERVPEDLAFSVAAGSGAHSLVYGSFMKLGDNIRVDVQLIDLSSGTTTGAEQARGADLFTLMDSVSARLGTRVLGETIAPTEFTSIAQLTTGSLDAYREYQAGLLAWARFLQPQAQEHFQRAVELDSTFARAWMRLGMGALRARDYQAATSHLERAERHSADASESDHLMIQAGLAQVARRWDESINYLEELLAKHPYDKEARFHLGTIYRFIGRLDDSRRTMEEVLALDPYHPGAVNELANQAALAGEEARADSLSRRYIELEPDQWNPYDTRAEVLRDFGQTEEAREMDRETIRRFPTYPTPYGRLVRSYLEDGDPEGARAALDPFRDDPDGAVMTRWSETETYVAEGRYLEAAYANLSAFEKASEFERYHFQPLGSDILPYIILEAGLHTSATGVYDEAEAAFRELHRLEPQSWGALFGLLSIYGQQERFDEMSRVREAAAADLAAVPGLGKARAESLLHFADGLIAWYRAGDARATVRLFGEAREARGLSKTYWSTSMGIQGEEVFALMEAGRASDALELIDSMEGLGEGGWPLILAHAAWYLRGRAYEALDEPDQAVESYQRLLDVAGDGIREVVLFRDTPERVARLRGEP